MENTSNDAVLKNKNALPSVSDNNTNNDFVLKENSNGMIDATLNYLSKVLLEEEIHEKDNMNPALWAMEKDFYNILGQEYPFLLNNLLRSDQPEADPTCSYSPWQYQIGSSTEVSVSGFNQVVEKGTNVLPSADNMAINFQPNMNLCPSVHKGSVDRVKVNLNNEENENQFSMINRSRGKMKSNDQDLDLIEGRNCKISTPNLEEPAKDAIFDEVLLCPDFYRKEVVGLREIMQTNTCNGKKIQEKIPDVKDLLICCSHSIAANDRQTAEGLLKDIRKQSSLDGNGNQRLAHVLADALEARLTVTGSESYNRFVAKRISTTDHLRVHRLYMTAAPFLGISLYFANQTILKAVEKASKLHIIDFGIYIGYQWPSLIQNLSNRKGGAIKLRITGIEFPRPGFRPAELVEETGRRLIEYARMFNVPFEYHGIASQWETIGVNDFKIETDEVLIVNSIYRFRQLGDETVGLDCPRDKVLRLIRHVRPHIFIFGNFNWTFGPFFVTRFKQAMSLYETMFDLLDTLIPRDDKVRQIIERDMFARDAINCIACEGTTRIERPETYKRWHQRIVRAGFEQLPLDPIIVKKCKKTFGKFYDDERFFAEEESNWFLQGWRGRTLYGLSTWKPK
ncbi:scarecrow-like protein 9 [Carex littledalei]|uniref:Scarecrow-like protein 9 n=1 Tax=Carex littledalei TaxID=544730 RepID=A0A833RDN6_9POAL|nr:scarecrow-like protein 9 [Carex littledalei]